MIIALDHGWFLDTDEPKMPALRAPRVSPGSFEKRAPGRGHCVVFWGKTLYSHRASLHPGVSMGTSSTSHFGMNL